MLQNPAGLGIATVAEVAHQPGAQAFRLADINEIAMPAKHAINAGHTRHVAPNAGPEFRLLVGTDPAQIGGKVGRPGDGWTEPGECVQREERGHVCGILPGAKRRLYPGCGESAKD